MGTRLWLCAVSEDTVRLLMERPGRRAFIIERVAKPPATQSFMPAVRWLKRRLERRRAAVEGDSIDIDKAWHGIHFLLTGTAWAGDPPLRLLTVRRRDAEAERAGVFHVGCANAAR